MELLNHTTCHHGVPQNTVRKTQIYTVHNNHYIKKIF